jgi:hypothetical protein
MFFERKDYSSMITIRTACAFLVFASLSFAQHLDFGFDFGVKGGVPFTDVLQTTGIINAPVTSLSRSGDYLIGPVVELRVPFGFALEVDGLYRGTDYNLTTNNISASLNANAWEIPYLAKFRFPIPLLKPFISAGGAYRTFTDLPNNITPAHDAFVLAGGLELRISRLRLSAEARWLRWGSTPDINLVRLTQNQGELLFGIVF